MTDDTGEELGRESGTTSTCYKCWPGVFKQQELKQAIRYHPTSRIVLEQGGKRPVANSIQMEVQIGFKRAKMAGNWVHAPA